MDEDFLKYQFEINVREGDDIFLPISLKQNGEILSTSSYACSGIIGEDVYLATDLSQTQKEIHISKDNTYKFGQYDLFIAFQTADKHETILGNLIINKGAK